MDDGQEHRMHGALRRPDMSDEYRVRRLKEIRADRLRRGGRPEVDRELVRREVVASQRLAGIEVKPAWLEGEREERMSYRNYAWAAAQAAQRRDYEAAERAVRGVALRGTVLPPAVVDALRHMTTEKPADPRVSHTVATSEGGDAHDRGPQEPSHPADVAPAPVSGQDDAGAERELTYPCGWCHEKTMCNGCYRAHVRRNAPNELDRLRAENERLRQRLADVYVKDRGKTQEINLLGDDNERLRRERNKEQARADGEHEAWEAEHDENERLRKELSETYASIRRQADAAKVIVDERNRLRRDLQEAKTVYRKAEDECRHLRGENERLGRHLFYAQQKRPIGLLEENDALRRRLAELEELTREPPVYFGGAGRKHKSCGYCKRWLEPDRFSEHRADCKWVRARRVLEDNQ